MKGNPCLTEEEKTGSASLGAPVFDVVDSRCEEEEVFSRDGPREMWETTSGSQPFDDETISFPLSQPDPPSRKQHHVSAVQRRRRSAACCSAPYMGAGQHQRLAGPPSATHGSAVRFLGRPPHLQPLPSAFCEQQYFLRVAASAAPPQLKSVPILLCVSRRNDSILHLLNDDLMWRLLLEPHARRAPQQLKRQRKSHASWRRLQ